MTPQEQSKAIYRRMVDEVVNNGHFEVIPELFHPEYVDHAAPPGSPAGLEGVKAVFSMFRGAFPDVNFRIDDMVADGDLVATLVQGTGTHNGPFMGLPPTGKHAVWRSVGFFRVKEGKIVEHWGIPDLFGLLVQLGVIPEPTAAAGKPSELRDS